MNGDFVNQVMKNTNEISKLYNQRKAVIARQYGEEHDAIASNGKSIFYLCHDVDTEYMAEYKFKLIITGDGTSQADGIYTNYSKGTNTYPNYDAWVAAFPEGNAVDCDGHFGAQCWDYACAFWYAQVGRRLETGDKTAKGIWSNMRAHNAGSQFNLVTDKTQIQKGDWVITGGGTYGHVFMAAENYNGTDFIQGWGQNQGGTPMPRGGQAINKTTLNISYFLGAFRYKNWNSSTAGVPSGGNIG